MNRRSFLGFLASAPIIALVPAAWSAQVGGSVDPRSVAILSNVLSAHDVRLFERIPPMYVGLSYIREPLLSEAGEQRKDIGRLEREAGEV